MTIDLSRPINSNSEVAGFGCGTVKVEEFLSVSNGDSVNCRLFTRFSPHLHATHTEFIGHYSNDHKSIYDECLRFLKPFLRCFVVEIEAERLGVAAAERQMELGSKAAPDDFVVTRNALERALVDVAPSQVEALVVRIKPGSYSSPVYFSYDAMFLIRELNVQHLLFDQQSVDREDDGGRLLSHKTFFEADPLRTITEFIETPEKALVKSGVYWLQIQFIRMEMDATLSRPILYDNLDFTEQ